jgi:hypothetical protein
MTPKWQWTLIIISSDTVMLAFLYDAESRGVKQIVVDPQNEPGEFVWIMSIGERLASPTSNPQPHS